MVGTLLAAAVLATACGGGSDPADTSAADTAADTAAESGAGTASDSPFVLTDQTNELYEGFIDCEPLPDGIDETPPADMVLPDGMVITELSEVGPLVSATGFIDATPIDLRDAFVQRDDVEVVHLEDEGFEAEILIDGGSSRTYIKASIRCRTGSVVQVLLGPDDEAQALPVPGQAAGGTAPDAPVAPAD